MKNIFNRANGYSPYDPNMQPNRNTGGGKIRVIDSVYIGSVDQNALPSEITDIIYRVLAEPIVPNEPKKSEAPSESLTPAPTKRAPRKKTAGWLVALNSDIRGECFTLYLGINKVGKGDHVDVDLGHDGTLAVGLHAVIVYESMTGRFFIDQCGFDDVYIDGNPVNDQIAIQRRAIVSVGTTDLLFVPLCGSDFSWDDDF